MNTINPQKILTQNHLEKYLKKIGFKTKPATFKNIVMIRDVPMKFTDEPVVWLPSDENNLELECVVSIENSSIYIYYYEFHNDLFRVWNKFQSEISDEEFIAIIKHVTKIENLKSKYDENI
jgi:hypothetical protein